ncbi:phosphoenolpyruvate carboxylase [Stylosanthes scabra]|uniref:Phosphoenolpyruvate carboxylase n=1 Tax=Stylosanthes scabra TaxID=79078 RepID=A0ABU6Z6V3_9FABA|nr:phosphoenolpyruvate carboxylase [Stylosanthes scabra]
MTDTTDDIVEDISFQSFEDDCRLLANLLNDVLQREVGTKFIELLDKIRVLAQTKFGFDEYESKRRTEQVMKVLKLCHLNCLCLYGESISINSSIGVLSIMLANAMRYGRVETRSVLG